MTEVEYTKVIEGVLKIAKFKKEQPLKYKAITKLGLDLVDKLLDTIVDYTGAFNDVAEKVTSLFSEEETNEGTMTTEEFKQHLSDNGIHIGGEISGEDSTFTINGEVWKKKGDNCWMNI